MEDPFSEIHKTQSAGAVVEHQIKELIRARRLVKGDRLPAERDLAVRLGVSRATLRGALQSLGEQGVLSGRQGSGWTVTPDGSAVASNVALYLSLEEVDFEDLFAARRAIEPAIAASAAEHRTPEQLAALAASMDAMRDAAEPIAYLQADSDFHALLASASQNAVFRLLLAPVLELLREERLRLSGDEWVISSSHAEHAAIFDAVVARDGRAASQAMCDHIDRFVNRTGAAARQG